MWYHVISINLKKEVIQMTEQFIAVTKSGTWKDEEVLQLEQLLGADAYYHPKKPYSIITSALNAAKN